jgi:hypothetical protein
LGSFSNCPRSKELSPIAGSKSDAWEVEVLKMAVGKATTFPATTPIAPYLALFTGTLSGDTPGTECTGGGYARITAPATSWGTPTSGAGTVSNTTAITFAQFTGSVSAGAAVTHFGLFDAVSAGHALYYGDLTDQTKTFGNLDTCNFPIGSIVITEG